MPHVDDPYVSVGDYKTWRSQGNDELLQDSSQDALFLDLLTQASRWVEDQCGRIFNQAEAGDVRSFTSLTPDLVYVDDYAAITEVALDRDGDRVYETVLNATDYDAVLAQVRSVLPSRRPVVALKVAPQGRYALPLQRAGVRITGTPGWPVVPEAIKLATMLRTARLEARPKAPLGIASSGSGGVATGGQMGGTRLIPRDEDVKDLLAPFRHLWGFA